MANNDEIMRWKRTGDGRVRLLVKLSYGNRGSIIEVDRDTAFQMFSNGTEEPYLDQSPPSTLEAHDQSTEDSKIKLLRKPGGTRLKNVVPSPGALTKEARAETVAKLIKELNHLKRQMFGSSDYDRLRNIYPDFLSFEIAQAQPDLKRIIISIRGSTQHIMLAQELAAAHYGRQLATIQDDWKRRKPAEFRRKR